MKLERVGPYLWRVPASARPGMRVPALVIADEALMAHIRSEAALEQLANGATLPGIVKAAMAMPDIHQGYGLPVGGVVATDVEEGGVISPGAIGFDINCGVRLLASALDEADVRPRLPALVQALYAAVPTGVGSHGGVALAEGELPRVLARGARWAVEHGWGEGDDLARLESGGELAEASADALSRHALERGRRQLGTLGSGNHFLEMQVVDEIYAPSAAHRMGVRAGQITIMIHTGSRGLGHQVCTDALKAAEGALRRYGISVPDRQLACVPLASPEAQTYLGAMRGAANFAFANRQAIAHLAREAVGRVMELSPRDLDLRVVYDVAHNIAKEEEHEVDGRRRRLLVHRKGATRAFPGQPVLVPGDMGRYSFLLEGTQAAMRETFGSTCHGAGRLLSRTAAVKQARGRQIGQELQARGVLARARGWDALAEEMPEAYKDVKDVVDVVHRFGISTRVARLRPIAVIKG